MKKKYILITGVVALMLTCGVSNDVNAEITTIYGAGGTKAYTSTEPNKILNISIPIELYGKDIIYWHIQYLGDCDVLTILIHFDSSVDNFVYTNPGEPHDMCEHTKTYTIPNDSYGSYNKYVTVEKSYDSGNFSYVFDWTLWIERDIEEPQQETILSFNLIVMLGIIGIYLLITTKKIRKSKK